MPHSFAWKKWLIALAILIAAGGGLVYLYQVPPGEGSLYLRCHFNWLTGLHCPGCGSTRCVHALLHGNVAQAAAYNVVTLLVLPALAAWASVGVFQILRGRPFPVWAGFTRYSRWFVLCYLLFGVLRNLPLFPFNLLAPHTL